MNILEQHLNNLEIKIKSEKSRFQRELKGYSAIKNFVNKQYQDYNSFQSPCDQMINIRMHFENILKDLNTLLQYSSPDEHSFKIVWDTIKSNLYTQTTPQGFTIIFSDTIPFAIIKQIHIQNPNYSYGAFQYFSNKPVQQDKDQFLGYLLSANLDLTNRLDLLNIDKVIIDNLQNISETWCQRTSDLQSKFEQQNKEYKEWNEKFINSSEKWQADYETKIKEFHDTWNKNLVRLSNEYQSNFRNLEIEYKEKLKYAGPVQEWRERVYTYHKSGIIWISAFTIIVVGLITLLYHILYDLPNAFTKNIFTGDTAAIKGLILYATIISFGAYLSRTFAKLAFSSFHIKRDAEEREKLTMVYLALNKDSGVSEKEKEFIIQSLFSRVDTGLLKDDGSPTLPGSLSDKSILAKL